MRFLPEFVCPFVTYTVEAMNAAAFGGAAGLIFKLASQATYYYTASLAKQQSI